MQPTLNLLRILPCLKKDDNTVVDPFVAGSDYESSPSPSPNRSPQVSPVPSREQSPAFGLEHRAGANLSPVRTWTPGLGIGIGGGHAMDDECDHAMDDACDHASVLAQPTTCIDVEVITRVQLARRWGSRESSDDSIPLHRSALETFPHSIWKHSRILYGFYPGLSFFPSLPFFFDP